MCIYMHVRVHACMRTYVRVCMCVYVCACVCVCVCVCVCACVCVLCVWLFMSGRAYVSVWEYAFSQVQVILTIYLRTTHNNGWLI